MLPTRSGSGGKAAVRRCRPCRTSSTSAVPSSLRSTLRTDVEGIGIYAGLDVINVPGATGYLDTNYKGKAEAALEALQSRDFVYLHVEAPDEAAHGGSLTDKIEAIERFDKDVVGDSLLKYSSFLPP